MRLRRSRSTSLQRRQVEHVVEALAGGLEQDRERRVLGRHREQVGRPLALLPQRGAPVGPAARAGAGPGPRTRGTAEANIAVPGSSRDDDVVDLVGVDEQLVDGQLVDRLGQADHDAVVAPHQLDLDAPALAQPGLQRHRPRRVDLRAERREHADPPVADLVAEPLDHDRAVVGHGAGRLGLLVEVLQQVAGRPLVEVVPGRAAAPSACVGRQRAHGAHELAERPAELERAARAVAVPERHLPGLAGRRRDDHPFVGDVLDPPGGRAEQERLARPALVDHLLVELADPGAVGQEHAEQPAVGDGAAVGDGQALRAGPRPHGALDAVPHDARPQLGELVGRVAARQQVEHRGEHLVGELGEVGGPADERGQLVDRPLVERAHGHDLLGQHVERVAGVAGVLDQPLVHAVDDDRRLDEVGPVLREELAPARLAHLVAGPADALQPA